MREEQTHSEMVGTLAIVGCGDSPNFQVWGARSDLKCRKSKKDKILKMSFKDWVADKERGGRDGG
jgi:hypothetical protein